MKASFKSIPVRLTLAGEPEAIDLTNHVAEAVYQAAANFAQHTLAHRIAESAEDGIELTDDEVEVVKFAIENSNYKFFVKKPLLEALGETFEEKKSKE